MFSMLCRARIVNCSVPAEDVPQLFVAVTETAHVVWIGASGAV